MSVAADAARWKYRRDNHLCGRCVDPLPEGCTKAHCAKCLQAVAEETRKNHYRRKGIVPPPRQRAYRAYGTFAPKTHASLCKSRYDRRRAAGLCTWCPNPSGERSHCDECRQCRKERYALRETT